MSEVCSGEQTLVQLRTGFTPDEWQYLLLQTWSTISWFRRVTIFPTPKLGQYLSLETKELFPGSDERQHFYSSGWVVFVTSDKSKYFGLHMRWYLLLQMWWTVTAEKCDIFDPWRRLSVVKRIAVERQAKGSLDLKVSWLKGIGQNVKMSANAPVCYY